MPSRSPKPRPGPNRSALHARLGELHAANPDTVTAVVAQTAIRLVPDHRQRIQWRIEDLDDDGLRTLLHAIQLAVRAADPESW